MSRCKIKNFIQNKVKISDALVVLGMLCLLTTGCTDKTKPKELPQKQVRVSVNRDNLKDIERMELCRRELEALRRIDSSVYNKRKAEFDRLMSGASLYNGVRNDIGNHTQSAVDALYRYRSDRLCADISSDVLSKLAQ